MKRSQRKAGKVVGLIALAGAIVATGCANSGYENLEYTQQKNRERLAAQEFASCHQEALIADQSAAKNRRPAGYLYSARILDRCLAEVAAYSQALPINPVSSTPCRCCWGRPGLPPRCPVPA